jgi:hypothetical protein
MESDRLSNLVRLQAAIQRHKAKLLRLQEDREALVEMLRQKHARCATFEGFIAEMWPVFFPNVAYDELHWLYRRVRQ